MSAGYKRYLYPIRRSCSCKIVVWNKIIIIKCKLNMQDDAYKRLAKQFNLSTPVWFCRSRFYRKKGHIVASKRAPLVRKSDSHWFFVIGKYKLHWLILWLNKTKASRVMQEQGKGSRAWICLLVIYSDVQCYDGNSTELEWFSEVLGQRQSWMRTMKTDFKKNFINSRISRKKIKQNYLNRVLNNPALKSDGKYMKG